MPRRVQDIVPATKRSIRNVTIDREEVNEKPASASSRARSKKSTKSTKEHTKSHSHEDVAAETHVDVHEIDESDAPLVYIKDKQELPPVDDVEKLSIKRMPITPPTTPVRRSSGKKSWKWVLATVVTLAVILIGAYIASTRYSRATFTIVPKVLPVAVNSTYVAQHMPGTPGFSYELMSVSASATTTVAATDGANVSTKAQGKVTLYNTASPSGVRLIAGTRLADATGRVYKLSGSIVIPGTTGTAPNTKAGSLTTSVVADQPGQQYNISRNESVGNLKVVAYKGTAKYDTVYAAVSGDIAGGYVGTKKTVSPTVIASTTASLKAQIAAELANKIKTAAPQGYIFYPSAVVTAYGSPMIAGNDPKQASISLSGTAYGVIFPRDSLVNQLVGSQAVSTFGGFAFDTPGLESLDVNVVNAKDFSPQKKNNLIVKVKGNFKMVGIIPVDELKHKFAGVTLAETQNILKPYSPIIQTGSGELVPPWAKVPTDESRISITVEN